METQFGVLGPLHVKNAAGASVPLGGAKARELLAALLLSHGQTVSVERLVDHLWGATATDGAPITLRTYVGQVRRVLAAAGLPDAVESRGGGYRLDVPLDQLDAEVFERRSNRGRELAGLGRYTEAADVLRDALALWRGEVLGDLADPEFARGWQARLDELRLAALETLVDCQLAVGRHGDVVGQLQDLVERYPYRERFAGQLVLALYRSERQVEALEVAAAAKDRLAEDLGLDAGAELRELEQQVLRQDSRLDHLGVVLDTARAPGEVLEVTSFVGRDADRLAVRQFLSHSRLITLTGFGGVGKTRLALSVMRELRLSFADGVHFVSLSEVAPGGDVAEQVAATLGLEGSATPSAADSVLDYLRERSALVILDNCEHVLDPVVDLVDRVLHASAGSRVVATSREPLRVADEVIYPVVPLAVPDPELSSWSEIERCESVRLFLDRARSSNPGLDLSGPSQEAVADICRRLEGIPLALELAAAQLRVVSATELRQRLRGHWGGLSRGRRNAPARQSTMRACIDWSFELCTPEEQLMWAKASIFADGFDIESVSAVCHDAESEDEVHDLLSALVDKSVVAVDRFGPLTRYRMLPPIREKGRAERDRQGLGADLQQRHVRYFADLTRRFHHERFGQGQISWFNRLRCDFGNLTEAVDHCLAEPELHEVGAGMLCDLREFLCYEGPYRRARHWARQLTAGGGPATPGAARGVLVASWCSVLQGDVAAASGLLEQCRPHLAGLDTRQRADFALTEGLLATFTGDLARAEVALREAAEGFTQVGDAGGLAHTHSTVVMSRAFAGDPAGALEAADRCLALLDPEEVWLRSWTSWSASVAMWQLGRIAEAVEMLQRGLRLRRMIAERVGLATTFEALGCLLADSQPELAAVLLGAAQSEWEKSDTSYEAMAGLAQFHDLAIARIDETLGLARRRASWRHGQRMGPRAATAVALGETAPGSERHSAPPAAPAVPVPALV